ncbi:MAG: hypothetical protein H6573_23865 [Lewinellaceae bacterium]|nr:hypothetical protein [Lewinellaceae bacterium]
MAVSDRDILKNFFRPGSVPLARHFEGLADSALNKGEDGIDKERTTALKIQAAPEELGKREAIWLYDFFEEPAFLTPGFALQLPTEGGNSFIKVAYNGPEKNPSVLVKEDVDVPLGFLPTQSGQLVISIPDPTTSVEAIMEAWRNPATNQGDFSLEATSPANLSTFADPDTPAPQSLDQIDTSEEFLTNLPLETDDVNIKLRVKYTGVATVTPNVAVGSISQGNDLAVQFTVSSTKQLTINLPSSGATVDTVLAAWATLTSAQQAGFSFEVVSEEQISLSTDQVGGEALSASFATQFAQVLTATYTGSAPQPHVIVKKDDSLDKPALTVNGGQLAIRTADDNTPAEMIMAAWRALPAGKKGGFSLEPLSQANITPFTDPSPEAPTPRPLDQVGSTTAFVTTTSLETDDGDFSLSVKYTGAAGDNPAVNVTKRPDAQNEEVAIQFNISAAKQLTITVPSSGASLDTVMAAWEILTTAQQAGFSLEINSQKSIPLSGLSSGPKWKFALADTGTAPGGLVIGENTTPHLFIQDGGNVGIGAPNPDVKLKVDGDISSTNLTVTAHLNTNSLSVGPAPGKLTVNGSIKMAAGTEGEYEFHSDAAPGDGDKTILLATYHGKTRGPQIRFQGDAPNGTFDIGQDGAGNFIIKSDTATLLRLSSSGNLTIGSAPDVNGSLRLSGTNLPPVGLTISPPSSAMYLDLNFKQIDKDNAKKGAAFSIDTDGQALFQWSWRPPGTDDGNGIITSGTEDVLMQLTDTGVLTLGALDLGGAITSLQGTINKLTSQITDLQAKAINKLSIGGSYGQGIIFELENNGFHGKAAYPADLNTEQTQADALSAITTAVGAGWRLPTATELQRMFANLREAPRGGFSLERVGSTPATMISAEGINLRQLKEITLPIGEGAQGTFLRVKYAGQVQVPAVTVQVGTPVNDPLADFDTTTVAGKLTITLADSTIINTDFTTIWNAHPNKGNFHLELINPGGTFTEASHSIAEELLNPAFALRLPAHDPGNFLRVKYTGDVTNPSVKVVVEGATVAFDPKAQNGQLKITIPAASTAVDSAFMGTWNNLSTDDKGDFELELVGFGVTLSPSADPIDGDRLNPVFANQLPANNPANFLWVEYNGQDPAPRVVAAQNGAIGFDAARDGRLAISFPDSPTPTTLEDIQSGWDAEDFTDGGYMSSNIDTGGSGNPIVVLFPDGVESPVDPSTGAGRVRPVRDF